MSAYLALPVPQGRGRETVERLIAAAEKVLERDGLEGATVPAIAAEARVSVGNVYKRFPDKDALLRVVYERFFTEALAANRFALDPAKWEGVTTSEVLVTLVAGMLEGYRGRRSLIRALLLYSQTHSDPGFRATAAGLRLGMLELFESLLRHRRQDIGHPHPERAIRFVVQLIGNAFENAVVSEGSAGRAGGGLLSPSPETASELARILIGYLRVRGTERPRSLSQSRR